ncbi:MAG TPA: dihydrolipoamide acetyltransferase family protein [Acidimicrobiia bacterium]|jgi:pyruvate dehydrogenase E2 component (dihydrolipoamide acetyltransferase)|nr:dihydrolipoamide acetyltransferase family protein [Acidimicrobiia bacterium]
MPAEVVMPVITEAGDDGVVTAWFVDEGSRVQRDQLIAEVQAEKVAQEVHSPGDGVVRGLVAINEPVPQGTAICALVDIDVAGQTRSASPAPEPTMAHPTARVRASPSAKRVARELGVDLASVTGTGPEGRITEADVRAVAGRVQQPAREMAGLRAVIARNMRRSVAETAPVTLTTTVDVTDMKHERVTAWIVRDAARALADHPSLNGVRDGDRFTPAAAAQVAVAIETEEGLVAPVVHNPADSTVEEVAVEIERLAGLARARKLLPSDYEDGTFTVTNLGGYGVDGFTPIINLPQVAILGIGALRTVPGFDETGALVARRLMTLSLTFDHAFVDGAPAAEFLARVGELLEGRD